MPIGEGQVLPAIDKGDMLMFRDTGELARVVRVLSDGKIWVRTVGGGKVAVHPEETTRREAGAMK